MTLGIPSTPEIQAMTKPYLEAMLRQLGVDVFIVRKDNVAPDPTGPVDEWGKPTIAPPPDGTPDRVLARTFIYQLPDRQGASIASQGSSNRIPDWEAIFSIDTPVGDPGFTVEYRGFTFNPIGVSQDIGNQGIGWLVRLMAPGMRGTLP